MSENHFTRQPRKHTDATIADFAILDGAKEDCPEMLSEIAQLA
ncbi:hypothetical protein [Mycobacterium dioxanotrophicus]|nr:hypothetical protein [Mycobacterium dioxanotrophicus]